MPNEPITEPVGDSVSRNEDVAVGEDLDFQRKWWLFERVIWTFFLLILVADLLGALGRGWLARTQRADLSQGLIVKYERIERAGTPSILTVQIEPAAVRQGEVNLFLSEGAIKSLGVQRISPQPSRSSLTQGGVDYTFPADGTPAIVEFQLQPSFIGMHTFHVGVTGDSRMPLEGRVLVLP